MGSIDSTTATEPARRVRGRCSPPHPQRCSGSVTPQATHCCESGPTARRTCRCRRLTVPLRHGDSPSPLIAPASWSVLAPASGGSRCRPRVRSPSCCRRAPCQGHFRWGSRSCPAATLFPSGSRCATWFFTTPTRVERASSTSGGRECWQSSRNHLPGRPTAKQAGAPGRLATGLGPEAERYARRRPRSRADWSHEYSSLTTSHRTQPGGDRGSGGRSVRFSGEMRRDTPGDGHEPRPRRGPGAAGALAGHRGAVRDAGELLERGELRRAARARAGTLCWCHPTPAGRAA